MKARNADIIQILIRIHNVAPDEGSQLIDGHTQFVGGFPLRVLAFR